MLNVKKLLTKILNGFGVIRSSGSVNVTAATTYTIATINLPAYLLSKRNNERKQRSLLDLFHSQLTSERGWAVC